MEILVFILFFPAIFGFLLPSSAAENVLYPGESLGNGDSLTYDSYSFKMQEDCNLVLYDNNDPIWASGTSGWGSNCILRMQRDGNLVIYNDQEGPVWASNTQTEDGNYILILQRDRNVVLYGGSRWATGTNTESILGCKMGMDHGGGAIVVVNSKGESIGSVVDMAKE